MPNELSQEATNKLLQSIRIKTGTLTCPACHGIKHEVSNQLMVLIGTTPDCHTVLMDQLAPVVAVSCTNCGHLMLFSAKALGVIS